MDNASGGTPPHTPTSGGPASPHDARRQGIRMLRWALGGLVVFLVGASGWTLIRAIQNPDVRLKQQWVPEGQAFDHAFWSPMLLTIVIGSGIVGWILWRAWSRIRAGEDLYAERFGRGVRRRGEAHLGDNDAV